MKPLPQLQSLPRTEPEERKESEELHDLDKVYVYKNDGFPKLVKIEAKGRNGNKFDSSTEAIISAKPVSQPNTRAAVQYCQDIGTK